MKSKIKDDSLFHADGTSVLIILSELFGKKPGHIRPLLGQILRDYVTPDRSTVILDFTDVDTTTTEEGKMKTLAEVMQEQPAITWRSYYPNPGEPFGTKHMFERIQALTERRTVRVAFGEMLCRRLTDGGLTGQQAKELLHDPVDGDVKAIRFRSDEAARAYLLGVSHGIGYLIFLNLKEDPGLAEAAMTVPAEG